MRSSKLFLLSPLFLLAACGNTEFGNKRTSATVAENVVQADSASISPEGTQLNSPERKIIYTADFHCKVLNVFTAAAGLEHLVKSIGGIAQESHMEHTSDEIKTNYYKPDSLRQTQTYTTTAMLTLRVPSKYADSIINAIPGIVSFIDSRTLKQNDVTWTYFANELRIRASANDSGANTKSRTSHVSLGAIKYQDDRQDQMINHKIANLQLIDDVSYATITVALSQPQQVYTQIIVNPDYLTRVPFGLQCESAIINGWNFVREIIIVLINIWPILLSVLAGTFLYRRFRHRQPALAKK